MKDSFVRNRRSVIYGTIGVIILTIFDQLTKYLAVLNLKDGPSLVLIPGVFELTYLENQGAAWGMLKNFRWLFLIFTAVACGVLMYGYVKSLSSKRYRNFRILCVFLLSGAVGNAIDRLFQGYVVDFFYFSLIDFPVFNVADCYVTVSMVLFLILYRKEVLAWIRSES